MSSVSKALLVCVPAAFATAVALFYLKKTRKREFRPAGHVSGLPDQVLQGNPAGLGAMSSRGFTIRQVGFANTAAVMINSQSSLKELNKHYDEPVNMDRFRPNIIVDGGTPYEEDKWRTVKIEDNV
ncbi:uncharacterized protein LOC116618069 isoform X2 [Nematostella vectensis]|uniref:uncharacterized protein LOC116618069 isoform X2 n=1 Tax=Nematostella vectensis TaxID=45351 RepID=UPI00207729B7|nr:uncharacterized protein LOC116618069 isoform X2 [Nematostella vectensis]